MKLRNITISTVMATLFLVNCGGGGGDSKTPSVVPSSTAMIHNHKVSVEPITNLYYRESNATVWKQHASNSELEANYYRNIVIPDCGKEYEFKALYANDKEIV